MPVVTHRKRKVTKKPTRRPTQEISQRQTTRVIINLQGVPKPARRKSAPRKASQRDYMLEQLLRRPLYPQPVINQQIDSGEIARQASATEAKLNQLADQQAAIALQLRTSMSYDPQGVLQVKAPTGEKQAELMEELKEVSVAKSEIEKRAPPPPPSSLPSSQTSTSQTSTTPPSFVEEMMATGFGRRLKPISSPSPSPSPSKPSDLEESEGLIESAVEKVIKATGEPEETEMQMTKAKEPPSPSPEPELGEGAGAARPAVSLGSEPTQEDIEKELSQRLGLTTNIEEWDEFRKPGIDWAVKSFGTAKPSVRAKASKFANALGLDVSKYFQKGTGRGQIVLRKGAKKEFEKDIRQAWTQGKTTKALMDMLPEKIRRKPFLPADSD